MSAVCVITPIVIAAWPYFSAAVTAAATSLGYQVVSATAESLRTARQRTTSKVELEIAQSELVTDQLTRDQRISVTRAGVTVTFSRDARGKASLCVTGEGYDDEALRSFGEEISRRVVQQYVYQRLLDEMRARQFMVVEETVDSSHTIRLTVRQWQN